MGAGIRPHRYDTGVIVPRIFKDWNRPKLRQDDLLKVFDAERAPGMLAHSGAHYQLKKGSPTYTAIAGALNTLQQRAGDAAVQQTELPFGDKYKPEPPKPVDMSQFMDILINFAGVSGPDDDRGRIILLPTFAITSDMGAEEAQSGYNLIRWMNKNADQVREIIRERLKYRVASKLKEKQEQQTEEIDDDAMMQQIEKVYRDAQQFEIKDTESPNYNPNAVARWLAARWLHVNWHKFTKIEKVAGSQVLTSMSITGLVPSLDPSPHDTPPQEEDFENGRKSTTWEDKVKMVMTQVGAYETAGLRAFDYRWDRRHAQGDWRPGMPTPVNESIEDQIERIDKLLQEKDPTYDLRIYSIKMDCSIAKDRGGEMQETQTEIRGIDGVTTVRTVGTATRGATQSWLATLEIKFELLGSVGRVKYRNRVLIPGLMKIRGLNILRIGAVHQTNVRGSIRTVRESKKKELYELAYSDPHTPAMQTPAISLDGVLEDWAEGGVQVYDVPTNTTDMQYHVMVSVEELWPCVSRIYRGTKTDFDGRYKHFIAGGAQMPVYVAVGQNGRIKVTGNEDYIWFAKKSGLKELPVFFSYQKQV